MKRIQFSNAGKPMAAVFKCALGFHSCRYEGPCTWTCGGSTLSFTGKLWQETLRLDREERAAPVALGWDTRSITKHSWQHSIPFNFVSRLWQKATEPLADFSPLRFTFLEIEGPFPDMWLPIFKCTHSLRHFAAINVLTQMLCSCCTQTMWSV